MDRERELDQLLERASSSALTSLAAAIDVEERLHAVRRKLGLDTERPRDEEEWPS